MSKLAAPKAQIEPIKPDDLLNALRNAGFRIKNESEENAITAALSYAVKTVATKNNVRLTITYAKGDLRVAGPADGNECDVSEQRLTNIGGWAGCTDFCPITSDDLIEILKRSALPRKKVKGGPEIPTGFAFIPTFEHTIRGITRHIKLKYASMASIVCLDDRLKCVDELSDPEQHTYFLIDCESVRGGTFSIIYDSTSRMWWCVRMTQGRKGNIYACERCQADLPKAIDNLCEADEELIRMAIAHKLSQQ